MLFSVLLHVATLTVSCVVADTNVRPTITHETVVIDRQTYLVEVILY